MCQGYPHRNGELDAYLTETIGMATDFGAGTFYEYHKMFSARAATLLLNHNVKLDWSVRDNDMYCKLFAGRHAIACGICSSMAHSMDFCPLSTAFRNNRRLGGTGHFNNLENGVAQHRKGDGICHAFNSAKGCARLACRFAHACMVCYRNWPRYCLRWCGLCCHSRHSTSGAVRRAAAPAGPTSAVPGVAAQTTTAQTVWVVNFYSTTKTK